jgi:hypothetical protein
MPTTIITGRDITFTIDSATQLRRSGHVGYFDGGHHY